MKDVKHAECYLYWIYRESFTDPYKERIYRNICKS